MSDEDDESGDYFCQPDHMEPRVRAIAEKIVAHRRRPLLIICDSFISESTSLFVHAYARKLAPVANAKGLDVLLHSPGGSLSESYRTARLLARVCNQWEALVPWQATSGATMIALGSNNIIMGDFAFLGPIDPQVASQRVGRFSQLERQSALEAFQALDYLRRFALETLDSGMEFLLSDRAVAPEVALRAATSLATDIIQPILNRIEPYALGEFSRDTVLSEEYARRISRPTGSERKAQDLADYKKLVNEYPAHEFMIDREEAESLGLKVSAPDDTLDRLFIEAGLILGRVESCVGTTLPKGEADEPETSRGRRAKSAQAATRPNSGNRRRLKAESGAVPEGASPIGAPPTANGSEPAPLVSDVKLN